MVTFKDMLFIQEFLEEVYYPNQTKDEKEYTDWENSMNHQMESIGHVQNIEVMKSGHFYTPRYPEELKGKMTFVKMREEGYPMRGDGISDKLLLDAIKKSIEKVSLDAIKKHDKALIVYKNKKGTYDSISIRFQNNQIHIITSMQGKRRQPNYNPQTNQYKIIVESESVFVIYLDSEF